MAQGTTISWITTQTGFGNDLTVMECPVCEINYAVPESWRCERASDHRDWHCPNMCVLHYPREESPGARRIKELERQLDSERRRATAATQAREWAESRAKGANIAAGKAKAAERRLRARVGAGVCPCCQRTFKQLAAHMKAKHPEGK